MALLPDSPAIGKGIAVKNVTTDQRGVLRPEDRVDIGAFQAQELTIKVVARSSPQSRLINRAFAKPLVGPVTADGGDPATGRLSEISTPDDHRTAPFTDEYVAATRVARLWSANHGLERPRGPL
jgi:hypothetical protein